VGVSTFLQIRDVPETTVRALVHLEPEARTPVGVLG
jgi:hypothetical protein